jgi:hypothetical protein
MKLLQLVVTVTVYAKIYVTKDSSIPRLVDAANVTIPMDIQVTHYHKNKTNIPSCFWTDLR